MLKGDFKVNRNTENKLPDDEMIREACHIIDEANKKGLTLRLLGAMGIVVCCSAISKSYLDTYKKLGRLGSGRTMFTDIDFAAYSKQKKDIEKFLKNDLGFEPDMAINALFGNKRLIYYNRVKNYSVDIFWISLSSVMMYFLEIMQDADDLNCLIIIFRQKTFC